MADRWDPDRPLGLAVELAKWALLLAGALALLLVVPFVIGVAGRLIVQAFRLGAGL